MNSRDAQDNIYWHMTQLAIRLRNDFARVAEKKYGLTWPQLISLSVIEPDSPVAMHDISEHLACDASNVTGIVDRLAAQKYIVRQEDSSDRRLKKIALTPTGRAVRTQFLADIAHFAPAGMSNLSLEERQQLQMLLAKVFLPR